MHSHCKRLWCVFAPKLPPPTNDRQLGISLSYLTGKRLTAHYLSLIAQEAYYVPVYSLHTGHHNGVWQSYESYQTHYTAGVYGCIWIAYIRQPLCSTTRRQAAAREASIVSPQEDESGRCGRAQTASTIDLAGSGWMFGAMWVTRVKSACHRQLNGVLRHPAETPSSEQKCDRSTLDGEQSKDWGSSVSERREDRQMQPFMWRFHFSRLEITSLTSSVFFFFCTSLSVCMSVSGYLLALHLCLCALITPITEIFQIWEMHLGNCTQKIKLVPLIHSGEIGGFHSWELFWAQVHFLFLQCVTGSTNFL